MKKVLFFSAFVALFMGAAFFYACQKEKAVAVATPGQTNFVTDDRSGTCSTIGIVNGINLIICGSDSGTSACYVCGEAHTKEVVNSNPDFFGFTGSSVFSLTNPTGSAINAGLFFNCALRTPIPVTVPAGATVKFSLAPDGSGCCQMTPCN